MDNNSTPTGNAGDNSEYSFSNFYCHPDFFSSKGDPAIKQLFAATRSIDNQNKEAAEKSKNVQAKKKKGNS